MNPYIILGLDLTATDKEIKEAYRSRSKETHPDMKEGSTEAFQQVNEAYLILSSPSRRKRYDETGETENETSFDKKFRALVQEIFLTMIKTVPDITSVDLIEGFRDNVIMIQVDLQQRMEVSRKEMEKVQKARDRVKTKEANLIAMILDNNITELKRVIQMNQENVEFMDKVIEHLKGYSYDVDQSDFRKNFLLSHGLQKDQEHEKKEQDHAWDDFMTRNARSSRRNTF